MVINFIQKNKVRFLLVKAVKLNKILKYNFIFDTQMGENIEKK